MADFEIIRQPTTVWEFDNPTLLANQIGVCSDIRNGVETDTGLAKLGNGVDDWDTLGYFTPNASNGDVTGPASATDNAITRFDGTTGKLIQNSGVTVDDNANVIGNNLVPGFTSTATAAGTTVLTVASDGVQEFTGVTTQTVTLPVVTTLPQTGFSFKIINNSTGAVTVNSSGANAVQVMAAGTTAIFTCILLTGTTAASWDVEYNLSSPGDVAGPASSTDNAIARYDSTTGKIIQNSGVVVSDANAITAGDGTTALPAYSFVNDPNTGIISSAANAIGFVTDGTERWVINASGALNPVLNNTYDIGNGIVNPRDINIGRQAIFSGSTSGTATLLAAAVAGTTTATLPTTSNTLGYLEIPQNSQSGAYTTVLTDSGKHILHPTADNNPRTFTIDSNANVPYPIGTAITFVNQINTLTIAITADTLVFANDATTGSRTLTGYGIATAIKIAATTWIISGSTTLT